MARYTGPMWKKSRRLGFSVLENGKELQKRPFAPGQHGKARKKLSDYGVQLQEKQKLRFTYGLNERQFKNLFVKAGKMEGKQGENFMILLETRLDNVVYRLGLARTRRGARQLVNHSHILVDGKKVNIASYLVKPGQVISLRDRSKNLSCVEDALAASIARMDFVSFDEDKREGKLERLPARDELHQEIKENLIVEYYNR